MRQTLVRFLLTDLWTVQSVNGTDELGIGWLLVPWAIYGLVRVLVARYKTGDWKSITGSGAIVWLALGGGILLVPTLIGGRVPLESIPIRGYGFMLFLGFVFGAWWAARRAATVGIDGELVWDLAMWIFFAGIAGARLFYIVQKHEEVFANQSGLGLILAAVNLPDGGLVLYGGVLLGIVAYVLFCRWKKIDALLMADIVVPSLFLGLALGRIGCLLNGCCFGDRCDLPWAVRFPAGSVPFEMLVKRGFLSPDADASLWLHPTQIYSSIDALVLALLTACYFRVRPCNGAVLAVGWLTYPITRFVMEYLRGDELGQFNTSLTIAQWVSIGMFVAGCLYTLWLMKRFPTATSSPPSSPRTPAARSFTAT